MGYCSICENLKSSTKCAKTAKEKDINKSLLQDHREAQALERKKVMHHKEKSLKKPEHYLCLMIAGMYGLAEYVVVPFGSGLLRESGGNH